MAFQKSSFFFEFKLGMQFPYSRNVRVNGDSLATKMFHVITDYWEGGIAQYCILIYSPPPKKNKSKWSIPFTSCLFFSVRICVFLIRGLKVSTLWARYGCLVLCLLPRELGKYQRMVPWHKEIQPGHCWRVDGWMGGWGHGFGVEVSTLKTLEGFSRLLNG